ncbi:response regulator transcription factor [Rhodococcus artemisiae]|uniref:Response regulator transcription factor n=1 Tax=Rhodococcus artemisiae TaxID=714159 RepID=A0ABU7L9L8_9NOCA|nr:response regulator transcription factor [Rhodococcus artemisiae]MEE2058239.1 response regulator transcription factor [Rhodococcus artemisiae]
MMIRVVICDDQDLLRVGYRMILEATGEIEVVGESSDGESAIALCRKVKPDVVLMDVRMPGTDGITATKQITARARDTRVIILTTFDVDEYVYAGLRAGASGFVLKDALADELVTAIRTVAEGAAVLAPSATRRLIDHCIPLLPDPDRESRRDEVARELTDRERTVFGLMATGKSNREIAAELFLSEGTVKIHVGRILAKLSLRDRVQAVVLAYETGFITPGDDR